MKLITNQFGLYTILYIIQSNMRNYKLKLIQMILLYGEWRLGPIPNPHPQKYLINYNIG